MNTQKVDVTEISIFNVFTKKSIAVQNTGEKSLFLQGIGEAAV